MPHTPEPWKSLDSKDTDLLLGEDFPHSTDDLAIVGPEDGETVPVIAILPVLDGQELPNRELLVRAPRLVRALLKAKDVIRTWHDAHGVESEAWQIYDEHAPEMLEINELLSELKTAGVI